MARAARRSAVAASLVTLALGWAHPAPWLLAVLVVIVLACAWNFAILRWLAIAEPEEPIPALLRE